MATETIATRETEHRVESAEFTTSNSTRRWKELLAGADAPKVLSPFLTSRTAERVLEGLGARVEVYTVFSGEYFLTGASSIRTLKRLADAGCSLYHLPHLHAKIVIGKGAATVGSQNLTAGGERNREAGVVLGGPLAIAAVESEVKPWLADRVLITPEMIEEMLDLIRPLRRRYVPLEREAEAATRKVFAAQERRDRWALVRRIAALQKSLDSAPVSRTREYGFVQYVPHSGGWDGNYSLLVNGGNLMSWFVDGQIHRLHRLSRYLCINQETGRIGWARVAKTRITKINPFLTRVKLEYRGRKWHAELMAEWDREAEHNLVIKLTHYGTGAGGIVRCWFSVADVEMLEFEGKQDAQDVAATAEIQTAVQTGSPTLRKRIRDLVLEPFEYTHNLAGSEATTFFGPTGSGWSLRLVRSGGHSLLVASRA